MIHYLINTRTPASGSARNTHPLIRLVIALLITTLFAIQTTQAEETLEDHVKQYQTEYAEFIKVKNQRDNAPPDSDKRQDLEDKLWNMQRGLDFLRSAITELGGDVKAIEAQVRGGGNKEGLRLPPDSGIKMELDETEVEIKSPKDFFPWDIKNWPPDAHSMSDNNRLFIALRTLEQYQTEWASEQRRLLGSMDQGKRHEYYMDIVKGVYEELYNIIFEVAAKEKPLLEFDVKRLTKNFSEDSSFAQVLVNETLDKYTATTKSKGIEWLWLDLGLRSSDILEEYRRAQKEMRRVLLTRYDRWDQQRYATWEGEVSRATNKIIASERKLIWLLGYNRHRDDLEELERLYPQKIEVLPPLQKKIVRYYIAVKYFELVNEFFLKTPYGSDPIQANSKTQALEDTQRDIQKLKGLLARADKEVADLTNNLRDAVERIGGRRAIMRTGLERALQGHVFTPHRANGNDLFYREILGEDAFNRYQDKISVLRERDSYMEFLLDEKEKTVFREQDSMRRGVFKPR